MQTIESLQEMILNQEKILKQLASNNAQLTSNNERLEIENKLLRQKVDFLLKKYFGGSKSEQVNLNQLLLDGFLDASRPEVPPSTEDASKEKEPPHKKRRKKKDKGPRLPDNLLTEEIVIDPKEVQQNPDAYRCIGEERTVELDVITQQFFKRVYVRKKYVPIDDRYHPPIIAAMFSRLIEKSIASPGLVSEIIVNKYCDHLPLYRQEKIFKERFGIELSRKTMSSWLAQTSSWLEPIYNLMCKEVVEGGYVQIDETPIRYLVKGGTKQGYFWIYRDPSGNVIYDWKTGRSHVCLNEMLDGFEGVAHCDGYSAYKTYSKKHPKVTFLNCLAHARRLFFESLESHSQLAGWFMKQISHLYGIEEKLRQARAGPNLREAVRQSESQMILNRIHKALKLCLNKGKRL
jgi:transposase